MVFTKGISGNPGGMHKGTAELKAIAREASPKAIAKLIEMIDHEDPRVALAASTAVLDRGLGKPTQAVEVSGEGGGPVIFQTIYEK